IVPEALQAFFFGRHVAVAFGEDIPPGLIPAVVEAAPIRAGGVSRHEHAGEGEQETCEPFHCDSFARVTVKPCRPRAADPILHTRRICVGRPDGTYCVCRLDAILWLSIASPHPAQIESAESPANSRKNSLSPRCFSWVFLARTEGFR